MLELRIIFTVVTLASLINSQHGSPLQNKDIESFLKLLKTEKEYDVQKLTVESSDTDSSTDEESANNSIYGLLKTMDVIDLIHKANHEKGKSQNRDEDEETPEHISNPIYRNYELNSQSDTQQIINQLLKNKKTAHLKKEKQRLKPNTLLGPINFDDGDRHEHTGGLNEYSKIFVILDPLAVQKSKNKDALTHLVSRILSLSSSTNEKARQERNKSHRYKGFRVKNDLLTRRYRRDSKENSMEDDYKPKRSRNDHGGGGGGGGRTAIPYIRQRGDIYERDH